MEHVSKLTLIKDQLLSIRQHSSGAMSSFATHLKDRYSLEALLEKDDKEKDPQRQRGVFETGRQSFHFSLGV